jgi:hypothetical protein
MRNSQQEHLSEQILTQLYFLQSDIRILTHLQIITMNTLTAQFRETIQKQTTVEASIKAAFKGLADQILAAGANKEELTAILAEWNGSIDKIAADVIANTPAANS